MEIGIAKTDAEITDCFSVIRELRPHISVDQFIPRIRHQEESGYQLVSVKVADCVVAAAGFRISENLAWGRFLYVDDLVTSPEYRSKGYGAGLLAWLKEYAAVQACQHIHLDSGVQRKDAHRFYEREGMTMAGYHYYEKL